MFPCLRLIIFAVMLLTTLCPVPLYAETITLKNGMQLEGTVGKIAGIASPVLSPTGTASGNPTGVKLVIVVDDGLRRTFAPTLQVAALATEAVSKLETFRIPL